MKEKRLVKLSEKQLECLIKLLCSERKELQREGLDTDEVDDLLIKIAMSPVITKWV